MNFKEALKDLDDDISLELSYKFDEYGNIPDELYLGAGYIDEKGMKALCNICCSLVLKKCGEPYNCDFRYQFKIFEKSLKKLLKFTKDFHKEPYGCETWDFISASLRLPIELMKFCYNLDNKFRNSEHLHFYGSSHYFGQNNCLDVKRMVYTSDICLKCTLYYTEHVFRYLSTWNDPEYLF